MPIAVSEAYNNIYCPKLRREIMRAAKTLGGSVPCILKEELQRLTQGRLFTAHKVKQLYMALPH